MDDAGTLQLIIKVTNDELDVLVRERVVGKKIQPDLVEPPALCCQRAYRRFRNRQSKSDFREGIVSEFRHSWTTADGAAYAERLTRRFLEAAQIIERDGAIVFGDLISRAVFPSLLTAYDLVMRNAGSLSLLHSYIDLRNQPNFLADNLFNDAFLHPLVIALIAYCAGGPVRVVDARGKDTQPLTVRAQDNMLHIDNTPFNDEFKIILTWEKGRPSGPKGQNFVFLPGTHKGARNCFVQTNGCAWSTENASIFISDETIDQAFEFQRRIRPESSPAVIEVQDLERPLTTVFAAGSLVHHRYRTDEGLGRSCIIIAFHPVADNPGGLMDAEDIPGVTPLQRLLFGHTDSSSTRLFRDALVSHSADVGAKLMEIASVDAGTVLVNNEQKVLSIGDLQKWKEMAASAPEIEDIKQEQQAFPIGVTVTREQLVQMLGPAMMLYDKHGPLDLILYEDNHEESRKWARNRIREMPLDQMTARLTTWVAEIEQPQVTDILSVDNLTLAADAIARYIDNVPDGERAAGCVDSWELISSENAYCSVRQLSTDLGEAICRCYSLQNFLSTSLFLFWACEEALHLRPDHDGQLKVMAGKLLRHYIATAIATHLALDRQLITYAHH